MNKNLWTIFIVIFVSTLYTPVALAQRASQHFNAGMLIPDTVFIDTKTFGGSAGIQEFLESKGSVLANTSEDFILKLKEPTDSSIKKALEDPRYSLARRRTAAELIWDNAQASGINPQVIIVTLNKEQGLITSKIPANDLQRSLNHAMGFDCPDGGSCNPVLSGFYFQLFGNISEGERYLGATKSLIKSYKTPGGRGPTINGKISQVGDTIELSNTIGGYEGIEPKQSVTIQNRSTAALYRYTPHVFNGNYNFWKFYRAWFNYPDGTLLKDLQTNTIYFLQKGKRRQIPVFVAQNRNLNLKDVVTASPIELANYTPGELLGPKDNAVVTVEGRMYLFDKNVKYPISNLVLKQKNIAPEKILKASKIEAELFATGKQLLPKEGTVVRPSGTTKTYLMQNGKFRIFSRLTLKQYAVGDKFKVIPQGEFNLYQTGGYVVPKDGTLIRGSKSTDKIYLINNGQRLPMTRPLFLNHKFKMTQVVALSDAEIRDIPMGKYLTPKEGTYFRVSNQTKVYVFMNGAVHRVSDDIVAKRKIKPNFIFDQIAVNDWPMGDDILK